MSGGLIPGAAKVEEILNSLQGKNPSSNPTVGNDYLVSSDGNWVDGGLATTQSVRQRDKLPGYRWGGQRHPDRWGQRY
ncbi:hypothetical protein H2136_08195 [Aeromonas hydrophila]|uniref:Uncharacterized protein n=1 Tax=Aeromonas hydrophila TaxID=644 RepID=A0A926FNR7_AERHY|nr:hypothetical protein [Aeromonas hydrophila]